MVDATQSAEQCQMVKPAIKPAMLLLQSFGLAILGFLLVGWFIGGFLVLLVAYVFPRSPAVTIGSFVALFAIIMMISYYWRKITLQNTEYKFYANRVEYYEGFLVKNRKAITYDKVSNVGQKRGIIERIFGLGTIYIDTPGSSPQGHELTMSYLENVDQMYDWVVKVTSKKASAPAPPMN